MTDNPESNRVTSNELKGKLVNPDDGFTLDENTQQYERTGYIAANWGAEKAHRPRATPGDIEGYRSDHKDTLGQRDFRLGGWRGDPDGGGLGDVLDHSIRFNQREPAMEHARRNGQQSIVHLRGDFEPDFIDIPYGAERLPADMPKDLKDSYSRDGQAAVRAQLEGRGQELSGTATPESIRALGEEIGLREFRRTVQREQVAPNYGPMQEPSSGLPSVGMQALNAVGGALARKSMGWVSDDPVIAARQRSGDAEAISLASHEKQLRGQQRERKRGAKALRQGGAGRAEMNYYDRTGRSPHEANAAQQAHTDEVIRRREERAGQ